MGAACRFGPAAVGGAAGLPAIGRQDRAYVPPRRVLPVPVRQHDAAQADAKTRPSTGEQPSCKSAVTSYCPMIDQQFCDGRPLQPCPEMHAAASKHCVLSPSAVG